MYKDKIVELRNNDRIKTAIYYECSLNKLESYFGKNIEFSDITPEFVNDYKKKMENDHLSSATVSMYLRSVRTICNIAIYKGLLDQTKYPFRQTQFGPNKIRIPKGIKRKSCFLTIPDILNLWSYNTDEHKQSAYDKSICEALNLWMFSYLANGMNLADMARLRYSNHYFKTKGLEFSFIRKKTERTMENELVIYVPIISPLKNIFEEYAAKAKKGSLVFPQILASETDENKIITIINQWNKNIAKRLAKVCKAVGIEDKVTMTWARHSYQTNLAHKKVPESYIDQAVGHADESVTDGYIGLYSTEDRFRYNSLLLEPDKEA